MIDGVIMALLGTYFTLIAFGVFPMSKDGVKNQIFLEKYGALLKFFAPLLIVCGVLLAVAGTLRDRPRSAEDHARGMAASLQAKLPMKIDEVTELRAAEARGPVLTYHLHLAPRASARVVSASLGATLQESIRTTVCSDKSLAPFISQGVRLHYIYGSSDLEPVLEFEVTKETCAAKAAAGHP